ncbi:MAG TPA: GAF domain-containing protein [Candidatus Baltobacteraceae bacterium]|nr:GAF domain-containing protein [Candidatus Baltobacteraceae bacterium]
MTPALRAIVVISIAAAFLAVCAPFMFGGYVSAYTGFHSAIGDTPEQAHTKVDAGSPAFLAGVRTGDRLATTSFEDAELLYPTFQTPHYRAAPIRASIIRGGANLGAVTISVLPGPPAVTLYGTTAIAAMRLLAYLVFLFVGCLLVLARPNATTWLLYWACLFSAPTAAAIDGLTHLPQSAYAGLLVVNDTVVVAGSPALLLFALVVPDAVLPRGWRRVALLVVATATVGVVASMLVSLYHAGSDVVALSGGPNRDATRVFTYAVIAVVLARLAAMRIDERARFGWVAFGIIVGVICNDLRNQVTSDVVSTGAGVATIIMPLSLMYAILRRHVIDVRFVISRTVVYGAVTTIVIGIIAAVDWATSQYLTQIRAALAIDAAVTIALGVALHKTYGLMEGAVDFLIYRRKHEAERYLQRLAKSLMRADRELTVDRALVNDPYDKLELSMAALFRRSGEVYTVAAAAGWDAAHAIAFEHDHDVVRFLAAERTQLQIRDLRAHVAAELHDSGTAPAVAVPIFEGDDLAGFALYGLHRDGTRLDPDELDTLEHLCATAAQAYIRIENLRYRSQTVPLAVTP